MATTAAILDIMVRADTTRATSGLRRLDSATKTAASTAEKASSSQQRLGGAFRASSQSASRYATEAKKADGANKSLDRSSFSVGGTLKSVAKYAAGAAAAYVGISEAKAAVDTTTDLAKATKTLNANLGLSLKFAGGFAAEARVRGVDTNKLTMLTKTLSTAQVGAADATSSQADAFKALGISTKELKALNPDQLMLAIADGAQKAGDGAERTKALGQLFGRGFGPLRAIFSGGAEGLRDLIKANTEAGGNLGAAGGGLSKVNDLIEAQRQAKRETQGLQVEFGTKLAPALTKAIGLFSDFLHGGFLKWLINAGTNLAAFTKKMWDNNKPLQWFIKYLIEGSKLLFKLGQAAVVAVKWVSGAAKDIVGAFKDAYQWLKTAWQDVGRFIAAPFQKAVGVITGFINTIIDVLNAIPGVDIGHVGGGGGGDTSTAGTGQQGRPHPGGKGTRRRRKQRGGVMVPGSGSGDTVPALLEPGEFVLNRNAVAAVGQSKLDRFNKDVPRFSIGGDVGGFLGKTPAGKAVGAISGGGLPDLPGVGSLPDWLKPAGSAVLAKAGAFIKDKLSLGLLGGGGGGGGTHMMDGKPVADWIYTILARARGAGVGFSVSSGYRSYAEQAAIYASGVRPAAVPGTSHHEGLAYPGGAVDISPGAAALAGWLGTAKGTRVNQGRLVYAGSKDPVHFSHPYGGGYQKGGTVRYANYLKHGSHWLHPHNPVTADEGATLLWQAGMSESDAAALSTVLPDESSGRWNADNPTSDAYGVWQILGKARGSPSGSLGDPIVNSINAAIKWRTEGPGAWPTYPGSGPRGRIMRDAVSGKAGTTKTPKGGKGGKKSKTPKAPTGNAEAITTAYQAALDQYAERTGLANELIGEGNLEALQRYQVGASQNPLLGIASPGMPTPTPAMSTNPSPSELLSILAGSTPGLGGKASAATVHNHHIYVDGKALKGGISKVTRSQSKRGHRPLPSSKGK